jgi:aspartate racemase
MQKKLKTIGILGGMGPEATAFFFDLIIRNTAARRDQDHIPIIVCNLPGIPDRTEAILGRGPSPLPFLVRGLRMLRRAGADFAVIPCITAHYFHPALTVRSSIPVVHLPEETATELNKRRPRIGKIGLIAATGTVRSRLFHDVFEPAGIEVLVPDSRAQSRVMNAISGRNGIKAGITGGRPQETIRNIATALIRRGAQAIVAGCTEVPLVLREDDLPVPFIEPMRIGALACIRRAGGKVRRGGSPDRQLAEGRPLAESRSIRLRMGERSESSRTSRSTSNRSSP